MIKKTFKHEKSKLTNKQAAKIAQVMLNKGKTAAEVAIELQERGYLGPQTGKPINLKQVHALMARVRANKPRKKPKAKRKSYRASLRPAF